MRKRIMLVSAISLCLMLTGSAIAVVTNPNETDVAEEPNHSPTDHAPSTVSHAELFSRAPIMHKLPKSTLASVSKYRVRAGDTLGKIANAWHIKVEKLACRNGIQNPDVIFPGKWIFKNGRKCINRPVAAKSTQRTVPQIRSNSNVETVIQFAISQVGEPYRWGAAGPNSWDCSGLVMVAFAQVGVSLPHYTGALISHGTAVSQSEMRRGDIVFPSSGHVGIYLGDGQYVNAPQPGETVKVSDVYAFHAARRII